MANFILQNTEPSTQLSSYLTSNIIYDGGTLSSIPAATNSTVNTILSNLNTTLSSISSSLNNISGTSTKLAKFTGAAALGNSILTEGTNTITLTGATAGLNEMIVNDSAKAVSVGVRGSGHSSGTTANGVQGDAFISTGAGVNGLNIIKTTGGGSEADYLRFYAGNTPTGTSRIHITGKTSGASEIGNVGINQEVPDKRLEVLDTATQLRLTHTNASKFVDFTVDTNHDLLIKPSSTGQIKLQPTTDSVDFFQVLDADGGVPVLNVDSTNERVGIGTAAPSTDFHITGAAAKTAFIESTGDNAIIRLKSAASSYNSYIDYEEASDQRWLVGMLGSDNSYTWADGTTFANSTRLKLLHSGGGSSPSELRFYEGGASPANYVGLKTADSLSGNSTYTFPTAVPAANGQVLSATTGGVMSWVTKEDAVVIYVTDRAGLTAALTTLNNAGKGGIIKLGDHIDIAGGGADYTINVGNGIEIWGGGNQMQLGAYKIIIAGTDCERGTFKDIAFDGAVSLSSGASVNSQEFLRVNDADVSVLIFDNCRFNDVVGGSSGTGYNVQIDNCANYCKIDFFKCSVGTGGNTKLYGPFRINFNKTGIAGTRFVFKDWFVNSPEDLGDGTRFQTAFDAMSIKIDKGSITQPTVERVVVYDDSVTIQDASTYEFDRYPVKKHSIIKTDSGTTHNLDLIDSDRHIRYTSASAITVNIRPDSTLNIPIGTEIEFCKEAAGVPTLTRGSGVALYGPDGVDQNIAISNLYSVVRIKKVAADKWQVVESTGNVPQAVARTATADGTGTGTIPSGAKFVTVTTADVAHIIILPAPVPGTVLWLGCEAESQAWELRSSTPASVKINGGSGGSAESEINAGSSLVRCVCVNATNWVVTEFAANGTESAGEAAA